MPRESIIKLLDRAIWAPSGDNSQPWKFSVDSLGGIKIFNCPDKDNPILNYKQTGSYVSHGAVIQNIRLLSKVEGYSANVNLFPGEIDCVAEIAFVKTDIPPSKHEFDLVDAIEKRTTNRNKYYNTPISPEIISALMTAAQQASEEVELEFTRDEVNKKGLAQALSSMEDIALQVPELHELFFKDIIWSRSQSMTGSSGLYIKTLELPLPAQFAMKYLLKHWRVTNFLNRYLGLSHKIASQMSAVYAASHIFGGIFVRDRTSRSYVSVGEVMQRVWLEATLHNVAVEPVTGLFFLAHKSIENSLFPIPASFNEQIMSSYAEVRDNFSKPGLDLAFLLRFGHSRPPTSKSRRLPPVIV